MTEYYKIDTQCMFDGLSDAEAFSLLEDLYEENDVQSIQVNYLLVNYLEDPIRYQYSSINEKLAALSTYASRMQMYSIFPMLDFVESGALDFNDVTSADVEDRIIFNRLINLAGGDLNDFSVLQEVRRVIEMCKHYNMFHEFSLGEVER